VSVKPQLGENFQTPMGIEEKEVDDDLRSEKNSSIENLNDGQTKGLAKFETSSISLESSINLSDSEENGLKIHYDDDIL